MAQLTEAYLKKLIRQAINEMAATPVSRAIRSSYTSTSDYNIGVGAAADIFKSIAELEDLVSQASDEEKAKIDGRIKRMIKVLTDSGIHTPESVASEMPSYRK